MKTHKLYSVVLIMASFIMSSVVFGQSCDTLRNYIPPPNNTYTVWNGTINGMLLGQSELTAGTDTYQVTAWAESYDVGTATKTIQAVAMLPSVIQNNSGTGTLIINVYSDNSGTPGTVIGSQSVSYNDLNPTGNPNLIWSTVQFQNPVTVSGKFYVGYVIPYTTPVDTFQLATTKPTTNKTIFRLNGTGPLNNTWEDVDAVYTDMSSNPIKSAFAMDILMSNASKPVANFTITNGTVACQGGSFNVDASSSSGTIDIYDWLLVNPTVTSIYDTEVGQTATLTTTTGSTTTQFIGLIASGGCRDSIVLQAVSVNPPVSATVNTKDATCSSQGEISITGATGGSGPYQYSKDGGVTYQSSGTFTPLSSGSYNVEVKTVGIGCSYTAIAQINSIPPATLNVGSAPTVCKGDQATLSATTNGGSATVIEWFDGTTQVGTGTSVQVSPTSTTLYDVMLTDTNGCIVTNQVTVTVDFSDPSFLYASSTICAAASNQTPTVTTNGGTFTVNKPGLTFADASTGEIDVAGSTSGSYKVYYTITSGSCTFVDSTTITITSNPDASFSYAQSSYCLGTGSVTPTFPVGASAGTFSATPTGLSINPSSGEVDLANSTPGTYTVENHISITGCASSTETTIVTINAKPTVDAGQDQTVCDGTSVTLTGSGAGAGGTYSWDNGVTDGTPFIPTSTTTYTVTGTDANGCDNTDMITVTVDDCAGINENETHSFVISPNPATNNVTISMKNSAIENVKLVALDGQIIQVNRNTIDSQNVMLDISSIAKGTYLLHITTEKGRFVQKLIKQ